ncbi:winged helix DNA-binding protein [Rhodobacteraceae bacterium]|nr:winged helix DNA-binding protein [Paracoccaceae bacterium]
MPLLIDDTDYNLEEQAGFILRKAYQRHTSIFAEHARDQLTSMQFLTLYRLAIEPGQVSQNALGRLVAMDAATTKGVVSRLVARGLIESKRDQIDRRRYMLSTTAKGRAVLDGMLPKMKTVTVETLSPLTEQERHQLISLLHKIT